MTQGDELGGDAHGDLRRRPTAEREPDRRVDPSELRPREPALVVAPQDPGEDRVDLAAAADHPEVGVRLLEQARERPLVAGVIAGDDQDQVALAQIGDRLVDLVGVVGEPLDLLERRILEELLAIVDDDHPQPDRAGERSEGLGDVAATNDDQPGFRLQELHEHLHGAAATHPKVADEVRLEGPRLAGAQDLAADLEHLVFDRAAADGPERAAVGVDQHAGANDLRRRTGATDDRGQRPAATGSFTTGSVAATAATFEELEHRVGQLSRRRRAGGRLRRVAHGDVLLGRARAYQRGRLRPTMMARLSVAFVPSSLIAFTLIASAGGCDEREDPYAVKPNKTVNLHKEIELTDAERELVEARKAAGHRSAEELAQANAAMFEKEAREYIKARLPNYRTLLKELRKHLDEIEKQAPKWKDQAAFAKYNDKYKKAAKELLTGYDELTTNGEEGGDTQADLSWAMRAWEQLNSDIGPGVADNEALPGALKDIRDRLALVETALDEIEKDETLEVPEPEPAKPKKKSK